MTSHGWVPASQSSPLLSLALIMGFKALAFPRTVPLKTLPSELETQHSKLWNYPFCPHRSTKEFRAWWHVHKDTDFLGKATCGTRKFVDQVCSLDNGHALTGCTQLFIDMAPQTLHPERQVTDKLDGIARFQVLVVGTGIQLYSPSPRQTQPVRSRSAAHLHRGSIAGFRDPSFGDSLAQLR